MKERKKGSTSRNRIDPKRLAETKRLLDSKKKELDSQEYQMLVKFMEAHPEIHLTLPVAEALWAFMAFIRKSGHVLVDEREVFCVSFSRLVKKANLK